MMMQMLFIQNLQLLMNGGHDSIDCSKITQSLKSHIPQDFLIFWPKISVTFNKLVTRIEAGEIRTFIY